MANLSREYKEFMAAADKRVDMSSSDLSSGGLMSATQRSTFIEGMYTSTKLGRMVTREIMTAKQHEISRVAFAGRILCAPPSENAEIGAGDKSKPTTGKTVLTANQLVGEVDISYRVIRQNIAKENFVDVVMEQVAKRCGVDLMRNALNGDTGIAAVDRETTALALFNGWIKQALTGGYVYDAANASLDDEVLDGMYAVMPAQYVDGDDEAYSSQVTYLLQRDLARNWRRQVSKRATPLGDAATIEKAIMNYGGHPVMGEAQIDTYTNGGVTVSYGLFTRPDNLVLGVHEDLTIKVVDWPPTRSVRFFVEAEVDAGFVRSDAVVVGENIKPLA